MSISSEGVTELELESGEWPITKATVYNNQAEVRRSMTYRPAMSGTVLLKFVGLPQTFDGASLRADVRSKNARLVEVNHGAKWVPGKADEGISSQMEKLKYDLSKLYKQNERLSFQQTKVSSHQQAILKAMSSSSFEDKQSPIDPLLFPKIQKALKFYDEMKVSLETKVETLQNKIRELEAENNSLQKQQDVNTQGKNINEATVMIYVPPELMKKGMEKKRFIDIDLFYIVSGASWKASYGIRVEKGSDKAALSYYGDVINNTQENWTEVELFLSTARPSIGGGLPPLQRKQVDFKLPPTHHWNVNHAPPRMNRLSMSMAPQAMAQRLPGFDQLQDNVLDEAMDMGGRTEVAPEELDVSAIALGDGGSAVFQIQRRANIDSDNKPHRQTIVLIDLAALYTHAASPKVSPSVYLKCSTKNQSAYPFLPGKMSVFIDGSFISDSKMSLVRPNEEFGMFLGIDDSVRLNYGPEVVKKKTVSGGGLMRTSKRWHKTTRRDISITNNTPNKIHFCIYEQLPLAKTSKINVKLLQPDMNRNQGVKYAINSFNHLEVRSELESGEKFTMPFEYSMEWPEGEEIQILQPKHNK